MNYPVIHHFGLLPSRCSLWGKGTVLFIHSFSSIQSSISISDVEERDDEGAIRFATVQSRFENKESLRNWLTIKPSCLQNKEITKAPFALASLIWLNHCGRGCLQISHTFYKLQSKACSSRFKQYFTFLLGGENVCKVKKNTDLIQCIQSFSFVTVSRFKCHQDAQRIFWKKFRSTDYVFTSPLPSFCNILQWKLQGTG